jgi:hypothetical protein
MLALSLPFGSYKCSIEQLKFSIFLIYTKMKNWLTVSGTCIKKEQEQQKPLVPNKLSQKRMLKQIKTLL